LLCTPDLDQQGAVLDRHAGYALIGGTALFMAAAISEGVDAARARFRRYADALSARHTPLSAIASAYPPTHHAWSGRAAVDPASSMARQLKRLPAT